MTDAASALASNPKALGTYDGRDIIRTSIIIRNTGDGLSESIGIAPEILHIGEKGYVLLEYEVIDHQHPVIKDTDCVELKQVLKAGTATIVDDEYAEEKIAAQADRIRRAKDAAKKQGSLDTALLERQHGEGSHADGLVEGCPICDEEARLEAEEAGEK